jgi:5S rRNA maturation endonuclease (ribonuclease M5)
MKAEHIEKLLNSLGCEKIRTAGNKIRSTCPLAPWKHGGGKDEHPSLAVFIADDDSSGVNCMSGRCGFHGSLTDLLYKLQKLSGRDMSALLMFVAENNTVNLDKQMSRIDAAAGYYAMPKESSGPVSVEGGKDYSDPLVRASMSSALPESAVEMMEKMRTWIDAEAWEYIKGPDRRLTEATVEKWKIGWHPQQRRVSVPQYDRLGRLVNLSGRYVPYWPKCIPLSERESRVPKWMHSNGFDRELFLFGEEWLQISDDGRGTIFICEGAFDVIFMDQCGLPNVAGINGSHINDTQVDKILKWFDSVVLLMDGDPPGIEAARKIENRLAQRTHVLTHLISDGRDPNQMEVWEVEDLKSRYLP